MNNVIIFSDLSFLPHLALTLCYYTNNCSLQKERSLDISSPNLWSRWERAERERRAAAYVCSSGILSHWPGRCSARHPMTRSCGCLHLPRQKKPQPLCHPGRVPRTRLAVFRPEVGNGGKTWVEEGTAESQEQKPRLGTSSLASIPGVWNGRVRQRQHQDKGGGNEHRSSRAPGRVLASQPAMRSGWKRSLENSLAGISVRHVWRGLPFPSPTPTMTSQTC